MVGAHGHADARMDVDDVPVEGHLDLQRPRDGFGNPLGVAQPATRHQDGELVAADAGDGVGWRGGRPDRSRAATSRSSMSPM